MGRMKILPFLFAALLTSCAPTACESEDESAGDDPDPCGLSCTEDADCPNGPPAWTCQKGQCKP